MAGNPFPILPQYQGDYLDAQRKMALAQALQEQALSPMAASQPGWNQMAIVPRANPLSAVAKVGQALLANKAYGNAVDAQRQLGQEQWQGLQGMFGGGQPAPSQGAMQQGGNTSATQSGGSPMNPGGLPPQTAAMAYMTDPAGYVKDMVAPYYKPTDATMLARQSGANVQQANLGALAKANYISPSEARPGGWTLVPDGKGGFTRMFNPNIPQGGMPVTDMQGNVVGAAPMPGAAAVEGGMAGAKAAAGATFQPVQGFDANGNPRYGSAFEAATGQNPFGGYQAPNGGAPNGAQGGIAPSLPIGTPDLVKGYVQRYQDTAQSALNAPRDIQAFRAIDQAAAQAKTGAAFDRGAYWKSMASIIPGVSPDNPDKVNADIIHKYSEQIATRNGGRSDAALEASLASITNSGMSPAAIHELTPSLIGQRVSDIGHANAYQAWMQNNGNSPISLGKFEQAWNQAYDPDVYRLQAMSPAQQQQFVSSLPKERAAALLQSRQALRQLGALPSGL
jgi:hypothetical protein